MIVQRVEGRRRIVNAEGGLQIAAADEIFGAPCRAPVLDAGIAGVPAAHIGADLPDVVEFAVVMSTTPAVRSPYCAGSAPVIRLKLPIAAGDPGIDRMRRGRRAGECR